RPVHRARRRLRPVRLPPGRRRLAGLGPARQPAAAAPPRGHGHRQRGASAVHRGLRLDAQPADRRVHLQVHPARRRGLGAARARQGDRRPGPPLTPSPAAHKEPLMMQRRPMLLAGAALLAGAQKRTLYVFFMTEDALNRFARSDGWTVGGDASIVVLNAGAMARLEKGSSPAILGLVRSQQGLMADLSLDGTKISRLVV